MITFQTPIAKPTIQNLFDILTNLTPTDIQQLCEMFGPCQASLQLHDTLTVIQTFNDPF